MGKNKTNKPLLKKILLIVWIVACTAIFICFVVVFIKGMSSCARIISTHPDPMSDPLLIIGMKKTIINDAIYLGLIIVLYTSFLLLAIPKLKSHLVSVKNGIDKPTL